MLTHFYDIESLQNVFTLCNYKPESKEIDIYILTDTLALIKTPTFKEDLLARIYENNYNFRGSINLYNLSRKEANAYFAQEFGVSTAQKANDPKSTSKYPDEFRLVCDTDPEYSEDIHPYLLGYNSFNYDTTMLALYFVTAYSAGKFKGTSAAQMRKFNNALFTDEYKDNMPSYLRHGINGTAKRSNRFAESDSEAIRRNMLASGRHLDVARLNEKQQHVGLKRLLGMLGWQILESTKLKTGQDVIETTDQLYDLIAYNVSDVVNLEKLFKHKVYMSAFELKRGLLHTYPELVYEKKDDEYKPDIRPEKVRRDRLTIDSSSAQFATKTLCPYGHLKDIQAVSFLYPSENKAQELGIERVNVLDETRRFFYELFPQEDLRRQFDVIYRYYKFIEGKNFNSGKNYSRDYGDSLPAYSMANDIPKANTCLPYFDGDGNPTSCFVTFSVGGIHGAEYNKKLMEYDLREWEEEKEAFDWVKSQFPEPTDLVKAKAVLMPNGEVRPAKDFIKSGATRKRAFWKDIEDKRPALFQEREKGAKLNEDYVFTSASPCVHEDFTSYYPNLLRMMEAFYNPGLGYDRYGEIFNQKSLYGKMMKDQSYSEEERQHFSILRNGVKLILNSASGAGDMNFESNIRMNNQIISMRVIGQLFSFSIGIAQAYHGSRIISTNTDGLYSVLEETLNNRILDEQSKRINVEIEPENTFLISKDSNNRLEYNTVKKKIDSASGGDLACQSGPDPTKSLAHPAVIDWAMCQYLILAAQEKKGTSLFAPFNRDVGQWILDAAKTRWDSVKWLNMFQNIIASSPGSIQFVYGISDETDEPIILQHYNRVFIMKDGTPDTVHLYAAYARSITAATTQKRKKDGEPLVQHDEKALAILTKNGVEKIPNGREAALKKLNSIGETWCMHINNHALESLTEEQREYIRDHIDMEKYLDLFEDCFNTSWRNITVEDRLKAKEKASAPKEPEDAQMMLNL